MSTDYGPFFHPEVTKVNIGATSHMSSKHYETKKANFSYINHEKMNSVSLVTSTNVCKRPHWHIFIMLKLCSYLKKTITYKISRRKYKNHETRQTCLHHIWANHTSVCPDLAQMLDAGSNIVIESNYTPVSTPVASLVSSAKHSYNHPKKLQYESYAGLLGPHFLQHGLQQQKKRKRRKK